VQTTAKYLPGIISNRSPGRLYSLGTNGNIAENADVSLNAPINPNTIGLAVSPTDFMFFGARALI